MTRTRRAARGPRGGLLATVVIGLVVTLGACGTEDDGSTASDTAAPSASTTESATGSTADEPTEPVTTTAPEPTTSASPDVPAGTAACGEVWVEGATIPRGYRGCVDDAGAYVRADRLGCSSGQVLIRYADRFYGVAGGTVSQTTRPLLDDPDYTETVEGCRA